MRATVVGNGRLQPSRALREDLRHADLVICADGGVRNAHALGVSPHVVIGDFDSADKRMLAWARRRGARLMTYPREKDQTDTELALEYALESGATEVDLVGVLGGRIDHALANVALLIRAAGQHRRARILDGRTELFLAEGQPIPGRVGDLVSLLPLSERVEGVATQGLRYPLVNSALSLASTLGISNEIVDAPATVHVGRGWLLIVITHRPRLGRERRVR